MAGDWIKIEISTPDKAEVFSIAERLGITPTDALGRLVLVWRWFDQHTESGNGVSVSDSFLDHVAGVTGFADAMRAVHWLAEGEQGLTLPRFDRHNGKTAKSRALTAKRVAAHKGRSANAALTVPALPREEKRRSTVPPISPVDESPPQRELGILGIVGQGARPTRRKRRAAFSAGETALAREVLEYLNVVSGRRFQAVARNVGFIVDRLAEGYPPHVLKLVAYHRLTKWRNDPKMIEYLRPETLYNETKCAQYAGQVPGAYFRTCGECSTQLLPDVPACPNGCTVRAEAAAEASRQPMPDHIRRREGESVKQWIERLKEAGKVAA